MSATWKIVLVIISVQWLTVSADPLFQGISFQRGFEINFKPWPLKPIAFIKEKWSPFGVFGKKFAIQKRSLDDMVPQPPLRVPRPAAPVFEHIEEIEHVGTPLYIIPRPIPPIQSPKPPPPETSEVTGSKPPPPPLPVPMPIIVNDHPPLPDKSHIIPPISTNMVIIQPTKIVNSHVTHTGLHTDITKVESIKEHIHSVKPHPPHHGPEESKPPVHIEHVLPPTDAHIVKPPVEPTPPSLLIPVSPLPVVPILPHPVAPVSPAPVVEHVPPPPVVELVPPPPVVEAIPTPIVVEPAPPPPSKEPEPLPPHPILVIEEKEKEKGKEHHPPHETHKNELFPKDNYLIKGSKMALQFGTVFLTLMAQFFDSTRATIDQMTNPPPKFTN